MVGPVLAALEGIGIVLVFCAALLGGAVLLSAVQERKPWACITLLAAIIIVLGTLLGLDLNGYIK